MCVHAHRCKGKEVEASHNTDGKRTRLQLEIHQLSQKDLGSGILNKVCQFRKWLYLFQFLFTDTDS